MKRIISSFITLVLIIGTMLIPSASAPAWNGDANGDGKINLSDVSVILKHIAKWQIEIDPLADFDENGKVNLNDASLVLKYIAKWNVAPDSLLEAEYGVSAVDFEIPEPTPTETVKGSEFGFDTEAADNSAAFRAAAAYLKEHPGTTLEIEKGVYKMAPKSAISFSGITNCVVDGGGSTFLYATRNYFTITGGTELFMVKNFTVDWDYETTGYSPTSVIRIIDRRETDDPQSHEVDYEFFTVDDAAYATTLPWDSMIGLDPDTLTVGKLGGDGTHFQISSWHKSFKVKSPNVITATIKHDAPGTVGRVFLVRHYNYSGPVFRQTNAVNITYKDFNVYSGPGGCIYASGQDAHHVRIDGVTVGLNPETADKYRMSTTADAINFKNTGGYLIIDNCDIGYQGDDCLNIHSTPGLVEYAYDNMMEIIVRNGNNFYVGCEVGFKKAEDFTPHEFTATVTGYELMQSEQYGQHYLVTLDRDVPADIESNWIIYNMSNNGENYIVRNSYFHENRARGLLLGSPNGLVENNHFYRHEQGAIHASLDHGGQWIEGTGVNNLIIRNNVFEECNLMGGSAYIDIFASSEFGVGGVILGECFSDILISGNTFINPKSEILAARSVTNLAFVSNTIKNPDELINVYDPDAVYPNRGKVELRGYQIKEATAIHNTWEASPYIAEDACEIVATAEEVKENELTSYGNNIVEAKE